MPNLRVVYNNAVDRGTITSTSAAITHDNLKTDNKSEVWRTVNGVKTATLSVSWTNLENVSCVALPICNLSKTATFQVTCYSDTAGTTAIYTGTATLCSAANPLDVWGLTAIQAASAYAYGGGAVAAIWFPVKQARKVSVVITDTNNLQNYLEASKFVVGDYFTPVRDVEIGAEITMVDDTINTRSDSGGLVTKRGTRHKKISVELKYLSESDRAAMWKLVAYCGCNAPVFMSVFPEHTDKDFEAAYSVYGKFTSMSAITATSYKIFSTPLEIEGI